MKRTLFYLSFILFSEVFGMVSNKKSWPSANCRQTRF